MHRYAKTVRVKQACGIGTDAVCGTGYQSSFIHPLVQ